MEIIGGEMEGVGLAAALSRTNNSNWIVVKAICDWADGNKGEDKENRQRIAAKNAIDFCKRLFNTDMLTHIDGVRLIRNTTSSGMTDILNGYALFYYRNYRMLTVHKLAKLAKISKDNLKFYESCQEGGEPFHSVPPSTIEKLQNVLECGDLTQGEIIDPLMVKYYNIKKKKNYIPSVT